MSAGADVRPVATVVSAKASYATRPVLIFAVALLARIALLAGFYTAPEPGIQQIWNTGIEVTHLATSLAAGAGLSSPFGGHTGVSAMLPPVYPALLYSVFRVFGPFTSAAAWAILFLQCLFSALTCLVIQFIGAESFGAKTGALAAWFWAACPATMLLPAFRLWDTSLGALLFAAAFLALLRADRSPQLRKWLVAGVLAGTAALVNSAGLPSCLVLFAWATIRRARRHVEMVVPTLLFLAATLAVLAPWTARNYLEFHRLIPLRSNFGLELWIGNHEGSSGRTELTMQPATNPREFALYASMGEQAYFQAKDDEARQFIRQHPGTFVRLTARRILDFWTGWQDMWGMAAASLPLVWLGLIGLAWAGRAAVPYAIVIAIYPLPFYITHADTRFRHALEPFLFLLAADVCIKAKQNLALRA